MAIQNATKNNSKRDGKKVPRKPRAASAANRAAVIRQLLKKLEQKLGSEEFKASLGDYIRLLQLQKELDQDELKEIKVTWVEPQTTGPESGK